MSKTIEITDANFEEVVLNSKVPVLVDFWASWCGPCKALLPIVEDVAKDFDNIAVVGKVNVDENSAIATQFGIRNIPTLLFFKNGEVLDKQIGVAPKSTLASKINNLLEDTIEE